MVSFNRVDNTIILACRGAVRVCVRDVVDHLEKKPKVRDAR